jgi:hypothetical protein
MGVGRRISVRLDEDEWTRLHALCQQSGLDVSDVVRTALRGMGTPKPENSESVSAPKSFCVPDHIISMSQRYLGWGRGNPRDEWYRQLNEFFALTFACKRLFSEDSRNRRMFGAIGRYREEVPKGQKERLTKSPRDSFGLILGSEVVDPFETSHFPGKRRLAEESEFICVFALRRP